MDAQQSPHTTVEPEMQDKTQHGTVWSILRQTCLILGQPVWCWDNLFDFGTTWVNTLTELQPILQIVFAHFEIATRFRNLAYPTFASWVFVKIMVTSFKWVSNVPNKFDQNVDMPVQFCNCRCVVCVCICFAQFPICKCVWKIRWSIVCTWANRCQIWTQTHRFISILTSC